MSDIISNEVEADLAPAEGQPQEVSDVVENLSEAEIERFLLMSSVTSMSPFKSMVKT
jgi:hypothetical protein